MHTLSLIKLFHLLGMILWFGTLIIQHGPMSRNLLHDDASVRSSYASLIHNLNFRFVLPGLVLSVAFGLWMLFGFYGLQAAYLHSKLTFGLLAAILTLIAIFTFSSVLKMGPGDSAEAPDRKKLVTRWRVLSMIASLFLLINFVSALVKFGGPR